MPAILHTPEFKKRDNNNALRSEPVSELISENPGFIVRYGTTIFFLVLIRLHLPSINIITYFERICPTFYLISFFYEKIKLGDNLWT